MFDGMTLVDDIKRDLRVRGGAQADVVNTAHAEAWRSAARQAGRALGRPVRTSHADGIVRAWLLDWPRNDLEASVTDARMLTILEGVAGSIAEPN